MAELIGTGPSHRPGCRLLSLRQEEIDPRPVRQARGPSAADNSTCASIIISFQRSVVQKQARA